MQEIELKLQIPAQYKLLLIQKLQQFKIENISLHAQYFDTPNSDLAQNKMAIRLRKENKMWMQTFKAGRQDHLKRTEIEIERGCSLNAPKLDLTHYDAQLFNNIDLDQLQIEFETLVERQFCYITTQNTTLEICLDQGQVKSQFHSAMIDEIEFEFKSGNVHHFLDYIKQWIKEFHLWIDVRSKAERGHLLAHNQTVSDALPASENLLYAFFANIAAISAEVATPQHYNHTHDIVLKLLQSYDFAELKHFINLTTPKQQSAYAQTPEFNCMLIDLMKI